MTVRVLIVDDEPLARERIARLLLPVVDVEVVGMAGDGAAAIDAIARERPDLVFLDIRMPGLDGFDVIDRIGVERMPAVIFTTAFGEFAERAFDVAALDYLTKPYADERFHLALDRARARLRAKDAAADAARLRAVLQATAYAGTPDDDATPVERILLRDHGRVRIVRLHDVDWIEADGNNVVLHVGDERHTLRTPLHQLAARLPEPPFLRLHRSLIANAPRIVSLEPYSRGEWVAVLRSGERLKVSRAQYPIVVARLRDG